MKQAIVTGAGGGLGFSICKSLSENNFSVAAVDLNTLDGNTSGAVNASTVTVLTGAASDVITAYDSSGITGLPVSKSFAYTFEYQLGICETTMEKLVLGSGLYAWFNQPLM